MGNVRAVVLGLGLALWASGCGDEGPPGAPMDGEDASPEEDAGEDAGAEDATVEEDGGKPVVDAGSDAAPLPDGGNVSECEGDVLEFEGARSTGRPLTAALTGNTTHLVYVVPSGGGSSGNNPNQGLRYVSFGTSSKPADPVDLVNVGIDVYNRTRDPYLVARGQTLDLVYTSADSGNPFDLFYMDVAASAPALQETRNNSVIESANVAAAYGDQLGILYSADTAAANMPGALMFQRQGAAGTELIPASQGYHAAQIAFAGFGEGSGLRGVAAFISDIAAKPGIFAQSVGADGSASGTVTTLSTLLGGTSGVDIAKGRDGGGALIYTEAPGGTVHQLRFREIDSTGKISGLITNLTVPNQDLRDISIAAYSHGYVIAYRRLGGLVDQPASIYLLFVDAQGNTSGTRLVHGAQITGGGLKVLVANDGRLIVLWGDTETVMNPDTKKTEIGLRVRAARLTCSM